MNDEKIPLEYFMWEWQHTFQIFAKGRAEDVFDTLDKKLKPNVFILGILVEERNNRHPVCIQPEGGGYSLDLFSKVKERADELAKVDPYKNVLSAERLQKKSYGNAMQEVLDEEDKNHDLTSYCCSPILIEGFMVSVVLQLNKKVLESHYSLKKNLHNNRYTIATSLIDAVIYDYLIASNKALRDVNPGEEFGAFGKEKEEIIRSAGIFLMYTPAFAGGALEGLHQLFNYCNRISSIRYEGQEGIGEMIVTKRQHPNLDIILHLDEDIPMSDHRKVRKILQMSSRDTKLLSDSGFIFGLGKIKGKYDAKSEDLFLIKFTKYLTWELLHDNNRMMQVEYGEPRLPKMKLDKTVFIKAVKEKFKGIEAGLIDGLWSFVDNASKQKHGTMVVISSSAKEEAKRLENQCIKIKPTMLEPEIIQKVTAIDGAVLIEPNTRCHAIGVILDGLASKKGDSSRGSRYNSAIKYVESSKYPCIAVVISQDGMIDIV